MTDTNNNPREELTNAGLKVVAFSGNARSNFLEALDLAKKGKFEVVDQYVAMANENLELASLAQKDFLENEAEGSRQGLDFLAIHAQDHYMTTLLLRDLIHNLIDIYKK